MNFTQNLAIHLKFMDRLSDAMDFEEEMSKLGHGRPPFDMMHEVDIKWVDAARETMADA